MVRLNYKNSFLLGYLACMLLFWLGLYFSSDIRNLPVHRLWGFAINFLAFFGGLFGILTAKNWGFFKSAVGRGIVLLSAGMLTWTIGNSVFAFYVLFLGNNIPYPSLADVFFIAAWPIWIAGMFYLSKAIGAKFGLKRKVGRVIFLLFPVVIAILSYYLLVTVARGGSATSGGGILKTFFDLAYPIGDTVIVTTAFLVYGLSFRYLGGEFKLPVTIILIGFVLMFLADFSFSYTTTLGTYYGGSPVDLLFVVALFTLGFGLSSMDSRS